MNTANFRQIISFNLQGVFIVDIIKNFYWALKPFNRPFLK